MMNATGMAFDRAGSLYVSSRYDGTVYRVAPNGTMASYAEGMGVATGIAFDREGNLYVGDRSGTIFKIGRDRQIFVFATARAQRLRLSPGVRQRSATSTSPARPPPASMPFIASIRTAA